jgi:hypothetical protein
MFIGTILLGIVVVVIGVIEWLGKISVEHSIAILTVLVGLWIALSGYGTYYAGRGPRA